MTKHKKFLIEINAKLELLEELNNRGTLRYDGQEMSFQQIINEQLFFWERKQKHLIEEMKNDQK